MYKAPVSRIGVSDLHWAPLTEDPVKGTPKYGEVQALPHLKSAAVSRNASTASNHADNRVVETASQLGDKTLTLGLIDVPPDVMAVWYGLEYEKGGLFVGEINPIYIAVMYKYTYSDGTFRYIRHGKVKPTLSDETTDTKAGSVSFQNGTYAFGAADFNNGKPSEMLVNSDDPELPAGMDAAAIERNFFADPNWKPADGDKFPPAEDGGEEPPEA